MRIRTILILIFGLLAVGGLSVLQAQEKQADEPKAQEESGPQTPKELLDELEGEYQAAYSDWLTKARADSAAGKAVDMTTRPKPDDFAPKFLAFAREHAGEKEAADAAIWIVRNVQDGELIVEAFEMMGANATKEQLAMVVSSLGTKMGGAIEQLLRRMVEESKDASTKAQAHYALARLLKRVDQMVVFLDDEERKEQLVQYMGEDAVKWLKEKDVEANRKEIEKLFVTIKAEYGDLAAGSRTFGEIADRELFEIRNLAVGCVVPEIEAEDIDGVEFKISDYRGKVVLLDFWGHW